MMRVCQNHICRLNEILIDLANHSKKLQMDSMLRETEKEFETVEVKLTQLEKAIRNIENSEL